MSATGALLVVVIVWLLIGVIASVVMGRRGHDPRFWGSLGALWGPLVIPLALSRGREDRELRDWSRTERPGTVGTGPLRVLVGVDGSADSERAAWMVTQLLGDRIGHLTLATVVDYDTADAARASVSHASEAAHDALESACEQLKGIDPETVVLTGRAAPALLSHALANDVDVIVVGARGRGLARALVGHVTSELVRQRDVPVLVTG
jgi:nucleotide-binding universal stress UspA family protein